MLRRAYAGIAGNPTSPATDELLTIAPPPDSSIRGISACIQRKTPVRFTRDHHGLQLSIVHSPVGASAPSMPALLNA